MLSAVANCTNTILGAGTMLEPVVCSHAGLILYEGVICFMVASSYITVRWLIAVADTLPEGAPRNYEGIARFYLGPFAGWLISAVFVFGGFSLTMAYMLLIAKSISPILTYCLDPDDCTDAYADMEKWVLWIVGLAIVLPLALLRDISKLKITSSLGVFAIAYAACFIVVTGVAAIMANGRATDYVLVNPSTRIFMCMGMMVSDFSCHISTMPVYMSLGKRRTQSFMMKATTTSLVISAVIYQLVAITSYLRFGDKALNVNGNVLATIAEEGRIPTKTVQYGLMVLANVGVAATLICSMPIAMWPLRSVVLSGVRTRRARGLNPEEAERMMGADPTATEWTVATCCLLTTVLFLAHVFPDVKVVMAIGGSVGGTFIVFIFPSAYYLAVVKKAKREDLWRLEYMPQLFMIVLGCFFGVLCFSSAIKCLVKDLAKTATTTTTTMMSTSLANSTTTSLASSFAAY